MRPERLTAIKSLRAAVVVGDHRQVENAIRFAGWCFSSLWGSREIARRDAERFRSFLVEAQEESRRLREETAVEINSLKVALAIERRHRAAKLLATWQATDDSYRYVAVTVAPTASALVLSRFRQGEKLCVIREDDEQREFFAGGPMVVAHSCDDHPFLKWGSPATPLFDDDVVIVGVAVSGPNLPFNSGFWCLKPLP